MKLSNTLLDTAIAEKNKSLKMSFLLQWNDDNFKTIQKAIRNHFWGKEIKTHREHHPARYLNFAGLDQLLGLAYTSSSSYAGYWVCNTEVYNDKYAGFHYIGFALGEDGNGYGILWDKDENEIIVNL